MADLPFTDAIAMAVSALIDGNRPPSHDELTRMFERVGLAGPGPEIGKLKRARAVLMRVAVADPKAGAALAKLMIDAVRASGGFRGDSPTFVGTEAVRNLQAAFRSEGFQLDDDGVLRPQLLDQLDEADWPDALQLVVRRVRAGATDSPLVTGSGKDLLEAGARIVAVQRTGGYDERLTFPATLFV